VVHRAWMFAVTATFLARRDLEDDLRDAP